MINDPYIEIINKTKSLNIDAVVVEQSIDRFLKSGADKTLTFLVHEKKISDNEARKLVEEIKKEFRSSYFANALYAGVFWAIFLAIIIIMSNMGFTNLVVYIFLSIVFVYCKYLTIANLIRAFNIK